MTWWARLNNDYAFHRKVILAGNEAVGAHARMLAYSAESSGRIDRAVALTIAPQAILDHLVRLVLLDVEGDHYAVHGFADMNPTRDVVEKLRAIRAENGRRGGRESGRARRSKKEAKSAFASSDNAHHFEHIEARQKQTEANGQANSEHDHDHDHDHDDDHDHDHDHDHENADEGESATPTAPPYVLRVQGQGRKPKKAPKYTPEKIALKNKIVEAFKAAVFAKKGIEAIAPNTADHVAAFRLAENFSVEEASAMFARALDQTHVAESNCTIRYIASKADSFRGKSRVNGAGRGGQEQPKDGPVYTSAIEGVT
jgi:hypothetical protein